MVSKSGSQSGLSGYLSPAAVLALAVGCSVGWGSFVMPGTTFLPVAGPAGTLLGILAGALVMFFIGVNYNYLMQRYPDAGGAYAYVSKICNHDHGFLCAWFLVLTYVAVLWANASALCLIGRKLLGGLTKIGWSYTIAGYDVYFGEIVVTLVALALLASLACCGRRLASRLQIAFAATLVAGVAVGFAAVFCGGAVDLAGAMKPMFADGSPRSLQVFTILALAPWAFVGFESVSHSVEEFRFDRRRVIWLLVASLAIGAALYGALALTAAAIQPGGFAGWRDYIANLDGLDGVEALPVFYAVETSMGRAGVVILCFATFAAIATGLIGNLIASSRLLYAMSRDEILPPFFSKLDRDGSPRNAMLFIVAISCFVPFVGRTAIGWIVDVTTIGACVAYGYVSFCAFVQAKREGVSAIVATGLVGLAASVAFAFYFLVPNFWSLSAFAPESYLMLAAWSIIGIVFFRRILAGDSRHRFGKSTVTWLAMIFLIFFTSLMWVRQATHRVTREVVINLGQYYETHASFEKEDLKAADGFTDSQMEYVNEALTGYVLAQMLLVVVALAILFIIYRNLTRRQRMSELKRVKAEASNKAKSVFLSNMSHDIRTPMNAIVGFIALAKRPGTTMEKTREYLAKISNASEHLLSLINDILEMSRIESGRMELQIAPMDLVDMASGVRDMFQAQMSAKGLEFTLDTEGVRHRVVMGDRNRMNRVFTNLVGNAYKYTPKGGRVMLKVAEAAGPAGAGAASGTYELRVKDSGIGMSPEFAAHIFDAFAREKTAVVSNIEGTGLGMSITKSIVELMGGTIDVETAPGAGTEFIIRLTLPYAASESAAASAAAADETAGVDFKGMRLLLAEDNEINREIATTVLADAGFEVDPAENGKIAFEKVRDGGPGRYDAIVMDVLMPVMGGYDATRAIRAIGVKGVSDVPIVALSANAFESDVKEALAAGMDAHVAKPLKIPELMATLSRIMAAKAAKRGASAAEKDD